MARFVVDVNIIMESIEGKKPDSGYALVESEFMFKLLGGRDTLFVNDVIHKKYQCVGPAIVARRRPDETNNIIYKVLMRTLVDTGRTSCIDVIKVDWPGLKKCDREFVGVALQSRSILVTNDAPLRRIAEAHPQGAGIRCATAAEALSLLDAERTPGE